MKRSSKATAKPSASNKNATSSSGAPMNSTPSGGSRDPNLVKKNSKELFIKKLQVCMKTFDYKDENKDVKGKTERLNTVNELMAMLSD